MLTQEGTKARGDSESPDAKPTTFKHSSSWHTSLIAKGY